MFSLPSHHTLRAVNDTAPCTWQGDVPLASLASTLTLPASVAMVFSPASRHLPTHPVLQASGGTMNACQGMRSQILSTAGNCLISVSVPSSIGGAARPAAVVIRGSPVEAGRQPRNS
jgi:hypothetical protein